MNFSISFIRVFVLATSMFFASLFTTSNLSEETYFFNLTVGLVSGLLFGFTLVGIDIFFSRLNLRTFNLALIGLLLGYLMGEVAMLFFNTFEQFVNAHKWYEFYPAIKMGVFLFCAYFGMSLTLRASEDFYASIPFIKLNREKSPKKDILLDWTVLTDSRIIDLASSGLLDGYLIIPRFIMKELYNLLESPDETNKGKAKRCLEILKKLENITSLELRYSDLDFPEQKDLALKLLELAKVLKANIITADILRLQQFGYEGIRLINFLGLANALKPINGEQLSIKIQRYGKEPLQGVGYLEDGTMVVVNGGAEFINKTIKAHVLSIKQTSSGRMIFCNVNDEGLGMEGNPAAEQVSHSSIRAYSPQIG